MKSILMKILVFISISAASFSAYAGGYWEYRQVCDYEIIETQEPFTKCNYAGELSTVEDGIYLISNFADTLFIPGHNAVCSSYTYVYRSRFIYSLGKHVVFDGVIPLVSQSNIYQTQSTRQVVEGSCREERVWIQLCNGCRIP